MKQRRQQAPSKQPAEGGEDGGEGETVKEVKAPPEFDDEDEDEDDVKLISNLILEIKVTDTSPCYIISFDLSQTHPLISHPLIRHNTPCNTPSALINLIRSTSSRPTPPGLQRAGRPPKTYSLITYPLLRYPSIDSQHTL